MKIYTSYYSMMRTILGRGIYPIGISLYNPRWLKGVKVYRKLAPTKEILFDYKDDNDQIKYTLKFNELLSHLNANEIVEELSKISGGMDIALLCYEPPNLFCHRHLVSKWLNDNGIECSEL